MLQVISLIFLVLAFCTGSFGQDIEVSGKVYAFKNTALNNIQVSAKKSKALTITSVLGYYSIKCKKGDKLVFQGDGFETVSLRIRDRKSLDVKMILKEGKNNEKAAVEHEHVSPQVLTNAITNFSDFNNDYINYRDIYSLIQSKFSGVQIRVVAGKKHVIIGAPSTMNASLLPMYILDGVQVMDISQVATSRVKEIKVLKGSEATIYGMRGSNGAVVINTRLE